MSLAAIPATVASTTATTSSPIPARSTAVPISRAASPPPEFPISDTDSMLHNTTMRSASGAASSTIQAPKTTTTTTTANPASPSSSSPPTTTNPDITTMSAATALSEPAPLTETNVATATAMEALNLNGGSNVAPPSSSSENSVVISPTTTSTSQNQIMPEVDAQILEALKSKDRLYVLKLGEIMEGLIKEGRSRAEVNPSTSYQRLLVHRCSAYYKLTPESDGGTKSIFVHLNVDSRVPARRLCELVPAESTSHPAFKIMRRSQADRRNARSNSHAGSVAGDDQDLSDPEPSEAGSFSSRGHNASGFRKRLTIEEREAAYNEARSRIFMDLEQKEKDMSASSSTLSLVSESTSNTSGCGSSSIDDFDDSVGTPATESEWSGPAARRGGGSTTGSVASSSRSLRSSAPPFNANGSGSSRDSRAASPAFTYASLYEPPLGSYDPQQNGGQPHNGAYMQPIFYPYAPHPGQVPYGHAPFPFYYPPYPHNAPQNHSDPATPMTGEAYATPPHLHHHPHMMGPNPYFWPPPPGQQPPMMHPSASQSSLPQQSPPTSSSNGQMQHPQHSSPNHPHSSPPASTASSQNMQGGYPPPPPQFVPYGYYPYYPPPMDENAVGPPPLPPAPPPQHMYPDDQHQRPWSSMSIDNGHGPHMPRGGNLSGHSPSKRGGGGPLPPHRSNMTASWSFGPGIGGANGGTYHHHHYPNGADSVGPRLTSSMRKPSGNSGSGSSNASNSRSDEVASNASSSTTSSSSRRTYTSTASSQHPLPARPDWAVGLKPQPTLHPTTPSRHHAGVGNGGNGNGNPNGAHHHSPTGGRGKYSPGRASQPPSSLQSTTEFPPLTQDCKKPPLTQVAGAWTNLASTARSNAHTPGSALHNHQQQQQQHNHHPMRMNGEMPEDGGYERPPPRGPAELYNPKTGNASRHVGPKAPPMVDNKAELRDSVAGINGVIDKMQSISLAVDGPTMINDASYSSAVVADT